MKILRAIAFLLLMIVTIPLCFAQGGGGNVGNGGNGYEAEFRYLGAQIRHYIEVEEPPFYFNGAPIWDEMVEAIDHVPVRFTLRMSSNDQHLSVCRGMGLNLKKRLIECDSDAWKSVSYEQKLELMFRLYLGFTEYQPVDDQEMGWISSRFLSGITKGKMRTPSDRMISLYDSIIDLNLQFGHFYKDLNLQFGHSCKAGVAEFWYLATSVRDWINDVRASGSSLNVFSKTVNWNRVIEAIDHVSVEFTQNSLTVDGREPKVCKNYPNQDRLKRKIECNYEMWNAQSANQKITVVFHEYLGITGYESNVGEYSEYPISSQMIGMEGVLK